MDAQNDSSQFGQTLRPRRWMRRRQACRQPPHPCPTVGPQRPGRRRPSASGEGPPEAGPAPTERRHRRTRAVPAGHRRDRPCHYGLPTPPPGSPGIPAQWEARWSRCGRRGPWRPQCRAPKRVAYQAVAVGSVWIAGVGKGTAPSHAARKAGLPTHPERGRDGHGAWWPAGVPAGPRASPRQLQPVARAVLADDLQECLLRTRLQDTDGRLGSRHLPGADRRLRGL